MIRTSLADARRVVVKVGSSSLTTTAGGLDGERLLALVDSLASTRQAGREVVLVSSGAIAAGLAPLGLVRRPRDLATQQAAASVGQGLLVARYAAGFASHGMQVGQVLLTADDMTRRSHYRNAYRTLHKLLALGVVPVVNENDTVATHEIRFGDNDRLAALVAQLVHADALVLLSDVDALYDGDPRRPGATRIAEINELSDLDGLRIGRTGPLVSAAAACRPRWRPRGSPPALASTSSWPRPRTSAPCSRDRPSVPGSVRGAAADPPGCCGSSMRLTAAAACISIPAPFAPWSSGGCRCSRPG